MANEILNLKPQHVWKYFYDLTQIPRPTGHTAEAVKYVAQVGKDLGLETQIDEVGNVLIRKPATKGYEGRPIVAMQGHLDMVPQKNNHIQHDFEKDPIKAHVDGEWVKAEETTLGADNGIGVAMALAVLADDTLEHGPLEALFTIDEEVGMVGAFALKEGFSKADIMLNLDSEVVDELYVGCAGGVDINVSLEYKDDQKTPADDIAAKVTLSGLKGGHSGVDIHLGRGNANKMMVRFLKKAVEEFNVSIAQLQGGSLRNAIPRDASAVLTCPEEEYDELAKRVADFEALYTEEYKGIEEGIKMTIERIADKPATIVPQEISDNVIQAVEAVQNGAITYLTDFPDTVEASSNLASIRLGDGKLEVTFLTRSSSESRKEMVASSIESAFALIGAEVEFDAPYNGWQPDAHSHVLEVMKRVYKEINGEEPPVKVMHAGLECGILQGVLPNTQMISFGPTIRFPHSPDEKLNIATVVKTWELLTKTLREL
ncbi:MAG: aminoacyl-histidine dipeptidase [Porphyromonas sp.]|nr:aminoacyl-histidine dipeptidase [Porphyromonas sp.]